MGRNRRQQRLRDRRSRPTEGGSPTPSTGRSSGSGGGSLSRPRKPAWRETLDSWGGFTVLGAIVGAVLIAGLLVYLNRPGSSASDEEFVARDHAGATQDGKLLGDPNAPVELVMFADFQCPFCKRFWNDVEPALVEDYVGTGQASLEFRDYAFIGPESFAAAEAAACAADQDRFWDFHDLLFLRQGRENSGVFSDGNLREYARIIADEFDDFDYQAWESCFEADTYAADVRQQAQVAAGQGIASTPTVLVNGRRIEGAQDLQVYRDAIEQALAAE